VRKVLRDGVNNPAAQSSRLPAIRWRFNAERSCIPGQLRGAVAAAGAVVERVEGLTLPVPVYVPGHGWRDLLGAAVRRAPRLPRRWGVALVEVGRWTPGLAMDMAVVAHRAG